MYILVLTVPMGRNQKQTHLLNDHKYLLAYFCTCSIYSVFNTTNLLLEAFISLGFKLKPERTVRPLGFSELAVCWETWMHNTIKFLPITQKISPDHVSNNGWVFWGISVHCPFSQIPHRADTGARVRRQSLLSALECLLQLAILSLSNSHEKR